MPPEIDDIRVQTSEGETSLKADDLADSLKEIDQRMMGNNIWSTITYSSGLISQIDYYSDAGKTVLILRRTFTRTLGSDGINYITGMVTTAYNDGGSTDSVITTVLSRTSDKITGCASSFSTTEPVC